MSKEYVPGPAELNAHVRTAVDSSLRWLDRALATPGHDQDAWEQRTFYARMILMRGLERGELLGWSLQRDAMASDDNQRVMGLRQAASYWSEARPDLHDGLDKLRKAADIPHDDPASRTAVRQARDQIDFTRTWLADLADTLTASQQRAVELGPALERPAPETSYGRDYL
jgi:hypothetical protein